MTMPDQIRITHQPRTMTTDSADRALSQPSLETSATGALTDIQLWELLPKRLEQNLLAMVQIAAPHHNLKPIDLLQNIAPDFVDYARAVLASDRAWRIARCGTPATPPAPEPGEVGELVGWLKAHANDCQELGRDDWAVQCTRAATLLQQQEAELALLRQQPRPTFQDAIRLAQGCHDYSGGHSEAEGEAWHGAIDTVVGVLQRAAVGPWDSQIRAVYGVGVEAGEVAVPELVAECPHCGYEGEMVPVTQAGEVEA
jgi:hypothetical protein